MKQIFKLVKESTELLKIIVMPLILNAGERFSEVLARYDYIVGDWGYEQLRLRGFLILLIVGQRRINALIH